MGVLMRSPRGGFHRRSGVLVHYRFDLTVDGGMNPERSSIDQQAYKIKVKEGLHR